MTQNPFSFNYITLLQTSTYQSKKIDIKNAGFMRPAITVLNIQLSNSRESYEKLKQIFVELMDAMLKYQDESGMWYQVVNFGGMDKNYLETSGSSIMAYALLKGVRLGFLPESYRAYGEKAFHRICDQYLSTDENGDLHLDGICLVAGLGGANRRPGTYDYYMSEPVVKDDAKGVGPFLLAYTEMLRLKK